MKFAHFLFAVSFTVSTAPATASAASGKTVVPIQAPVQHGQIPLTLGRHHYNAFVNYAPGTGQYFVMPSLSIVSATIPAAGGPEPFIDSAGMIDRFDAENYGIDVTLINWPDSAQASNIFSTIQSGTNGTFSGISAGESRLDPDVNPQVAVALYLGAKKVSTTTVDLGQISGAGVNPGEIVAHFTVPIGSLAAATPSQLSVHFDTTYNTEIITTDWSLSTENADSTSVAFFQKLASTPPNGAGSPIAIIPLGGAIDVTKNMEENYTKNSLVNLTSSNGVAIDPKLLNRFLDFFLSNIQTNEKNLQLNDSSVVSFITSDGIRATMALGELTTFDQKLTNDFTLNDHDLDQFLSKQSSSSSSDTGVGLDIPGIGGGSFNNSSSYSNMTDLEKKAVRDRFRHEIHDAALKWQGHVTFAEQLNVSDVQRFSSRSYITQQFSQNHSIEATLPLPIPSINFNDRFNLFGHPDDRDTLLDAVYNDLQVAPGGPFQEPYTTSPSDSFDLDPNDNGGTCVPNAYLNGCFFELAVHGSSFNSQAANQDAIKAINLLSQVLPPGYHHCAQYGPFYQPGPYGPHIVPGGPFDGNSFLIVAQVFATNNITTDPRAAVVMTVDGHSRITNYVGFLGGGPVTNQAFCL